MQLHSLCSSKDRYCIHAVASSAVCHYPAASPAAISSTAVSSAAHYPAASPAAVSPAAISSTAVSSAAKHAVASSAVCYPAAVSPATISSAAKHAVASSAVCHYPAASPAATSSTVVSSAAKYAVASSAVCHYPAASPAAKHAVASSAVSHYPAAVSPATISTAMSSTAALSPAFRYRVVFPPVRKGTIFQPRSLQYSDAEESSHHQSDMEQSLQQSTTQTPLHNSSMQLSFQLPDATQSSFQHPSTLPSRKQGVTLTEEFYNWTDKDSDHLSSYSWDVPDNKSGSGFTTSVSSSEHVLASGCFSPTMIRDDPASRPGTSGLQSQTTAVLPPASKQMTSLLPPPPFSTPPKLKPVEEVMSNITGTDVASLRNLATSLARESIFGKDELAKKSSSTRPQYIARTHDHIIINIVY